MIEKWISNIKGAFKGLQSTRVAGGARASLTGERNYLQFQVINPSRLASAFADADRGELSTQAHFFTMIEQADAHIHAELAKRRRGVAGLPWRLQPVQDASQAELDRTAELEQMLRGIDGFSQSLYDLTDAIGKGFSALEIDWRTGDVWLPKRLVWTPQSEFVVDTDSGDLMMRAPMGGAKEHLIDGRWMVHEHNSQSGYLENAALFRVLAWCYVYKAYNARDMQRFLEVYGLPLRLGKFMDGTSKENQQMLLRAVSHIGSDTAAVVPQSMQIEFIQAQQGKVDDFLDAIRYWDQKISVATLGSTLTSQVDSASNSEALGKVHESQRLELIDSDARQLAPTLSKQLVQRIALVNGMFDEARCPSFDFEIVEEVNAESWIKVMQMGAGLGMQIPVDWAHKKLQIPMAGKDDEVLTLGTAGASPAPANNNTLRAALVAALAGKGAGADSDPIVERLIAETTDAESRYVEQLYSLIAEAGGLDEAAERLIGVAQKRALQNAIQPTLGDALATAQLAGLNADNKK